jgi:tetratricopeptide (TPR) repeat protein
MIRIGMVAGMVAALAAAGSSAQAQPQAAQGAQPAAQTSVQQQFDAATIALDAQRWQDALTVFDAIEARLTPRNTKSLGLVRVRKAEALEGLGRRDEAAAALRQGLAALPADDPSLSEDRLAGYTRLGELSERALDYAEALQNYRAADALGGASAKPRVLRGLIQTGMFYDAAAALADADRGLALAAAHPGDKQTEGVFRTLRGRVLLNMNRPAEARRELDRAIALLGGLTERVDVNDIAARSDLAISALLEGKEDDARKYMSWTGAGHFPGGFPTGADMLPPPCDDDLAPGDVAVIEISIRADGTVVRAVPIYASRAGPSALGFARAATFWSWRPEELGKIPPLFRALTRLELRCSNATRRPSVPTLLRTDLDTWLEQHIVAAVTAEGSDAARLKPLEAELARREAAGSPPLAAVPALIALADNALVGREEERTYLSRGLALARAEKAPAPVLAWFGIRAADVAGEWRSQNQGPRVKASRALLADPQITADPRAATAVRLDLAEALAASKGETAAAIALLSQIPQTPGLGAQDPMRSAALARLASLQLAAGDPAAARAAYAASGLNADQCALLDSPPRLKSGKVSFDDYPKDAVRWGFEGWAMVEYDLSAAGETVNVRTTIAYPPFVFGKSANALVDRREFEKTFRPQGALGCGGLTQNVRFNQGI